MSREAFTGLVGGVFEHSPWIAEAAWAQRPFATMGQLHLAMCQTVKEASESEKLALIRAHPDLVGRAALAGTLTPASASEQVSAGLDKLSPEEISLFQQFNDSYRSTFGFPFVICARLNKKEAILNGFRERLKHSRKQEIAVALGEIFKIAEFRLRDLITERYRR